ncbi:MAG: MFS transporter [Deltaproteobacteria bacterium]|nr:MFS transporter [Deltaproteobacteria bacterium]
MPLYVQGFLGGTASQAGVVLLLASLAWTGGSVMAGQGMNRYGYRAVCVLGMGLMALGYGLFVAMETRGEMVAVLLEGVLIGTGMGMVNVTALVAGQNGVPVRRIGIATATVMLFRTFGGAFGVSMMGSVLFTRMYRQLFALSAGQSINLSAVEIEKFANPQSLMDPAARLLIPDRLLSILVDSLGQSIWYAFVVGFVLSALGLCASFFVDPLTPATTKRPEEHGRTRS